MRRTSGLRIREERRSFIKLLGYGELDRDLRTLEWMKEKRGR